MAKAAASKREGVLAVPIGGAFNPRLLLCAERSPPRLMPLFPTPLQETRSGIFRIDVSVLIIFLALKSTQELTNSSSRSPHPSINAHLAFSLRRRAGRAAAAHRCWRHGARYRQRRRKSCPVP